MRGFNTVIILGRIGHDITLRQTSNGRTFVDINIATNRKINQDNAWISVADWHRVRFWGENADRCARFLSKGSPIVIEGSLRSDSWDTETGEKKYFSYIHGSHLHILPKTYQASPSIA